MAAFDTAGGTDGITVLHVDDADDASTTVESLERVDERFEVITESAVGDGLDRLAGTDVDCIVSGYELPGRTGVEFLEAVREEHPDLPFVLFTGEGDEAVASAAVDAGVTAYLPRDRGTDQRRSLADRIESAVERYRARHTFERERSRRSALFENAPDPIVGVRFDGELPVVDAVNAAFEDVFGYDEEVVVGRTVVDALVPDAEREEHVALRDRVFRGERVETEVRRQTATGVRDFRLRVIPVDVTDISAGAYAWYTDVTERREREARLERSQRQFEAVFNSPDSFIGVLDPDGTLRRANRTALEFVDADPADVEGEPFPETPWWTHSADLQRQLREWIDRAAGGEYVRFESTHHGADGQVVVADAVIRPVTDDGGEVTSLVVEGRDISEHKAREEELERERDRYTTLFENLPNPVVHSVRENGEWVVRNVNAAFEATFGYDADEVAGEPVHQYTVLEEDVDPDTRRQRLFGEGELHTEVSRETTDGTGHFRLDVTLRKGTGTDDWAEGYAVYTDITDRTERERRTEALHDATRSLVRADSREEVAEVAAETTRDVLGMPINGVFLYDAEADALEPAAVTEEVVDLMGEPPVFEPGGSLSWEVFESGEARTFEDVSTEPGRYNPETSLRSQIILPLGDQGVLVIGSTDAGAFDETDVAMAQILAANTEIALARADRERELERKNERLEEFASIVSHDLRNPLNVASGRLSLLARECESDHIDDIERAHDRMEALIDDLLTLARVGETATELAPVDLAAVVERCWQAVDAHEATLAVETDCTVLADESRLQQLLANLLRNAVEHGGEGVTVTVGDLEDGFFVADDGPGIPPDEREDVFEAGYSTAEDGTGFGLSIVEQVAEAHGWTVRATASDAGGARFEVTGVSFA